jgi:hypothetical protein
MTYHIPLIAAATPACRQCRNGRHDERKSRGEIVAVAGGEPHAGGVAQRQDANEIVVAIAVADGGRLI